MANAIGTRSDLSQVWAQLVRDIRPWLERRKIEALYADNAWHWAMLGGMRAPTEQELHANAYSLAWEAFKAGEKDGRIGSCSSGRMSVRFLCFRGAWTGHLEIVADDLTA